ncbi:Dipeptide transport ATP-binding protein DppD [Candidatus Entotheonellaceae bacterium PAL068K]
MVMYASRIVEAGPKAARHPYTRGLLRAVPRIDEDVERLEAIEGQVPSPLHYPPGCNFYDRCPLAIARCRTEALRLEILADGRQVACFRAEEPTGPVGGS